MRPGAGSVLVVRYRQKGHYPWMWGSGPSVL